MTFAPKTKSVFQKLAFKTEKTLPCQKTPVFDRVLPLRTEVASPSDGRNFWPTRIFYGRRIFYIRNTWKSRFLHFLKYLRVEWWDRRIHYPPWSWKDSKVSFPWSQNHMADFRPVIEISIGRWWSYEKKWPKIPKKVDFFNFLKNHPEGI